MNNKFKGYVKFIKVVAVLALTLSVTLFTFFVVESSLTGDQTKSFSRFITNVADEVFGFSDSIEESSTTQSIELKIDLDVKHFHVDETLDLIVDYYPKNTRDKDVVFSVDEEKVATIDENGALTFHKLGDVKVTATLKSNPDVYAVKSFWCIGENIFDPAHPERKTISFTDGTNEVKKGKHKAIAVNESRTFVDGSIVSSSNPQVAFTANGNVYGVSEGSADITVTFKHPDGDTEIFTLPITVVDSDYQAIADLSLKEEITIADKETIDDYRALFKNEEGRPLNDYICRVKSSNVNILRAIGYNLVAKSGGKVTLTFTSVYNPTIEKEFVINVNYVAPDSLSIVGPDIIQPHGNCYYTAYHAPEKYPNDVTWSIVSGKGEITEEGKLKTNAFGKITIRCQSNISEDLYVEKTIDVGFFTDAYSIVRKLMGHMGLHAVYGFCLTIALFLLTKRKAFTAISPAISLLTTILTEFIQYFVPGRTCYLTDVITDFTGAVIGILLAIAVVAVIFIVWRLISKKSFDKLIKTIKTVNLKNVFRRNDYLVALLDDNAEDYCSANAQTTR